METIACHSKANLLQNVGGHTAAGGLPTKRDEFVAKVAAPYDLQVALKCPRGAELDTTIFCETGQRGALETLGDGVVKRCSVNHGPITTQFQGWGALFLWAATGNSGARLWPDR